MNNVHIINKLIKIDCSISPLKSHSTNHKTFYKANFSPQNQWQELYIKLGSLVNIWTKFLPYGEFKRFIRRIRCTFMYTNTYFNFYFKTNFLIFTNQHIIVIMFKQNLYFSLPCIYIFLSIYYVYVFISLLQFTL